MDFLFSKKAKVQLIKLDKKVSKQILKKLILLKNDDLFELNLSPVYSEYATHRIRIGAYRLLLKVDLQNMQSLVLKVAHRREVYKS